MHIPAGAKEPTPWNENGTPRPPGTTAHGASNPGSRASQIVAFLLPAGVVLLSRIPFLGPGYGLDPDAWRVAWAAHTIASTGTYEASRFPGFPVHEILCALLSRGGPFALAGASAVMAALAGLYFALSGRAWMTGICAGLAIGCRVTCGAWLVPLAFALAGLYFAFSGRAWMTGTCAGLAIGCRVTCGAWLVPLAFALVQGRPPGHRRSAVLACVAIALAVGGLAYLPPLLVYGTRFLHVYPGIPQMLFVIKAATVDLWGIPGSLALAGLVPIGLLLAYRRPGRASISGAGAGSLLVAWAIGLVLFLVLFLLHPMKAAYLIPAVPLTLLLCGRVLERKNFLVICVALIASPWLFKVSQPGKADSSAFPSGTRTIQVHGQAFVLDWLHGPVLVAHARTEQGVRYVEQSLSQARRLSGESVVVAWEWLPQIRVRLGGKVEGRVRYTYLLTRDELRELHARGVAIYDLAGAEENNVAVNGISLRENGARPLASLDPSR